MKKQTSLFGTPVRNIPAIHAIRLIYRLSTLTPVSDEEFAHTVKDFLYDSGLDKEIEDWDSLDDLRQQFREKWF